LVITKTEQPKAINMCYSFQPFMGFYYLSFLKDYVTCYLPSSTSRTGIPSFFLDSEDSLRNPYSKAYSTAYSSFFSPTKVSKCVVSTCSSYQVGRGKKSNFAGFSGTNLRIKRPISREVSRPISLKNNQ